MPYVLGILEGPHGPQRYVVHCTTSGFTFPRLFDSPEAARQTLDQRGIEALVGESGPPGSAVVVRLVLCSSWSAESAIASSELWGIASSTQLLSPLDAEEGSLKMVLGPELAHVACEVQLSEDIDEERALCEPETPLADDARLVPASDPAVRGRRLCPECIAQISAGADSV